MPSRKLLQFIRPLSYIEGCTRQDANSIGDFIPKSKSTGRLASKIITGLDRRYDVEQLDAIDVDVLETFPYEYPGRDVVINIDTTEFTAVCPYSGLPDFAQIKVNYIPDKKIIELRSFKYYLLSYRSVGIYQEHVVNRILEDLLRCCQPRWMQVIADYATRGGVHTIATVESRRKKER